MKQYMRNQFEYFGIQTPELQKIFRTRLSSFGTPEIEDMDSMVRDLWKQPEREFQHCGMYLLDKRLTRLDPSHIPLLEHCITTRAWWDTVDHLATHQVAYLFRHYPAARKGSIRKWDPSDNIWLNRSALLFQLKYKQHTDAALLFRLVENHAGSEEFFIQKAIGWALREYSKTAPEEVRAFIEGTELKALSRREALKHLEKTGG
jgi:3-methyladenine DNA glycosylase AlkD